MSKTNIYHELPRIKSSWELLYNLPMDFQHICLVSILDNLIVLFRKNTFNDLVGKEHYYPQPTANCRYYIKPDNGSCGKNIQIVLSLPEQPIPNHTICPEILSPLHNSCKYDFRVWIGITSQLQYYICPTFILRLSNYHFDINNSLGSLTNTALYSDHFDYQDKDLLLQVDNIVRHTLMKLPAIIYPDTKTHVMLTGWDFILDQSGKLFVLEVNCNPSICILHKQVITEFIDWYMKYEIQE
jgi:hypothetical protein